MTFKTATNAALGLASFNPTTIDATPICPVGTIAKAYDDTLGDAEFIYLPGVAATVAGDLVTYDLSPVGPVTVRATGLANSGRPVAVALVAALATQYGWYQIGGCAITNAVAGTAAGTAMLSATTGQVQSTAIAGAQILGARISSAVGTPSAGKVYMTINRPHMQGQIT